MKKLLVCLIVMGCCIQASALDTHWGFRIGATFSMLAGEDWEYVKQVNEIDLEIASGVPVSTTDYWGWGFTAGLLYEISLFRFLAIQPEVTYTSYHGGMKLQNDTWSADWVKLGMVYRLAEAPLLLKIRFSTRLAVFAGPLVMFRFLAPKETFITPDDRDSTVVTYEENYKKLAYGAVGGIEFRSSDEIFLDIRYNYNLNSLDDFGSSWKDDTIFHGIIASVGFLF